MCAIGDAGDLLHRLQQLWRASRSARLKFGVLDLHVDRRGQAEIQHLADDVGGLEIELRSRERLSAARADLRGCSRRSDGARA